jgi:hypothetical protein
MEFQQALQWGRDADQSPALQTEPLGALEGAIASYSLVDKRSKMNA